MIKFILHGGNLGDNNKDNYSFFNESTRIKSKDVNILMCYLSSEDENIISDKFRRHSSKFKRFAGGKSTHFKLAEVDKFSDQVKWSDLVYLAGGFETSDFVEKMSVTKNLELLFEGKVVAGSSAGVNCLAKYYYGNTIQRIESGLGIINIKTYCHYKPGDEKIV